MVLGVFGGSSQSSLRASGAQAKGSLACLSLTSDTQCCQLYVRVDTMQMVRSFLMFLLVEDFLWPACAVSVRLRLKN